MPEFHTISHHKSVAKACYVVARDLLFFLFQSSKQNSFPGNANQSVSPSFKDYFQSSVGVTYHLLLQKKVEENHKLG